MSVLSFSDFVSQPLNPLEQSMKRMLQKRVDAKNHIPTATELAEFFSWAASEYSNPENFGGFYSEEKPLAIAAKRALTKSEDRDAFADFEKKLERFSEGDNINPGRDISADKMFRYLPSHWHSNVFFEVYYSYSGECPIFFKNERVVLRPGALLIIAPSVVHASPCFSDDCVLVSYLIRASTFNEIFWRQLGEDNLMTSFFRQALSGKQTASYLQFDTENDTELRSYLYTIYNECDGEERYASEVITALMNVVFSLLLRRYEGTARLPRTEDFFWRHEFSAILSYLQTNFASTSIEKMAARFHYSERQISRIVKSCMGVTYQELVLKLKMERAKILLKNKSETLGEIATQLGYSSLPSFHRAFTRYYGYTPGSARE